MGILRELVLVPVLLIIVSECHNIGLHENGLRIYRIRDIDFDNTKITKPCLLAQFNATLELHHTIDGNPPVYYTIPIPQDADTEGSYCNINYESGLQLHFDGCLISMKFQRQKILDSIPKKATYCDHCNYGTWNMSSLEAHIAIESRYEVHARIPDDFKDYAKWLTEGIDINRAFKCEEADTLITIPMIIDKVLNVTTKGEIKVDWWDADITFRLIQVQPFLVFTEDFFDPYLCRDFKLYHFLVIMIPLTFFASFIIFERIKADYGCPPKPIAHHGLEKLESDTDVDESTNILADEYSAIQIGLRNPSIAY